MKKLPWKPWHEAVKIREELRSGELSLSIFAADLYDVAMKKKRRSQYEDPAEFFALTYPTYNLRELAKDVVLRLAKKNGKAVHQLELTYGGGKTHALITLFHLVNDPGHLPGLPAVREFCEHIGMTPPETRVGVLAFDKLDVEKGMEVLGSDGDRRWLRHPWSILAFQLAGKAGLRLLHAKGKEEERESAPAENLLMELLSLPAQENLSTLILLDEVLMYAREKVALESTWRGKLLDFFQCLTQAATKVDSCAIVASLLATDPRKSDTLGKELTQEIYSIFRREREQGVQPVVKEDVAEVLRRRFFTPESIQNKDSFRSHVVAALKGILNLDDQSKKEGQQTEERFFQSYPFHPDLTEIFYTKWTNLESFQRTRGVLRTFALALREAEKWDDSPLIAANIFLGKEEGKGLSEAARELANVAATEEYEGKKQEWSGILEGELSKAQEIQKEIAISHREIEQAVFATFLHSQPVGQKALTRELLLLLGSTHPDKIELEKGLIRWAESSWFLDESMAAEAVGENRRLPKSWRLGSKPNLKQMHHDACGRILSEAIESRLMDEVARLKSLKEGAGGMGIKVHSLPMKPKDVEDDGDFHFVILGPNAACDPGKPSAEAKRFIEETTSSDRPRVFRNSIVLAVPSKDGLELCRSTIREYLGWEEVKAQLKKDELDPIRQELLNSSLESSRKQIPDMIRQAYSLVVTVSEKNEIQAFKLVMQNLPLFTLVKQHKEVRIQDSAISAEALLPGGPYDLWREGETSRRVKDLAGAFAQFPHLPKMLRAKEIMDTLVQGAKEGFFVLQITRPDRTKRTFWYEEPDETSLKDPGLEVVLPEAAKLGEIPTALLVPGKLAELWKNAEITFGELCQYFSGNTVKISRQGYDETLIIPKADKETLRNALHKAVAEGKLWLTHAESSILGEEIPHGLLCEETRLQSPPPSISIYDIMPENLPTAWHEKETTATAIVSALSQKAGKHLPWLRIREAIQGAMQAHLLECTLDSTTWPCTLAEAPKLKLRIPQKEEIETQIPTKPKKSGTHSSELDIKPEELQELAEVMGELLQETAGYDLKFRLRLELTGNLKNPQKLEKINAILKRVSEKLIMSN